MNRNHRKLIARTGRRVRSLLLVGALVGGQLPLNAAPPAPAQSGPAASTANNAGITQRSSRRRWTKESALQRYSARQPRKTTRVTPYLAGPERPGFLESPIPTTLSGQGAGNTRAGHSTAIVITDTNDPAPEKPVKSAAIAERQSKEESQQERPADSAPSQQVASKPAQLLTPEKSEAVPSEPTPAAKPKPESNLAEKSDKVETPTPIEEPTPAAAKPKLTSIPTQASPRTPAPAVALEAPVESSDALPAEPTSTEPQSPATESSSIYSMVPTPAAEPEQTASAPRPNPQLEEAKCMLRLFNAFGLKEKAEKPTDGLNELAESTPTIAERPSGKPTSLQPATAPAMIAASPTTSRYTAVPQSAPEHCDELKPGVEVDNSTTTPIEPPMLTQTPEVEEPGTAEPSESEQPQEKGSLVEMKDLQGPRHLRPAPSTPAPTALAEVGPESTKTYRVFDESSDEDEKAAQEPATVAQTPKTTDAAPKQNSLATARPNKSGRDVRKRLRLAIDELVGGPVRPRTEKPQPKNSSADRTPPSPEKMAAKSPATATQSKSTAKVPAQSQDLASADRDPTSGTVQPSENAKLASRPKAQPEATQPAKPRIEQRQLAEVSRPETQSVKPSQAATESRTAELAQNQPSQVSKPKLNPRGSVRPQAEPRVAEVVPPVVQQERRLVPRNPRPQVANTQRPNSQRPSTQIPDTARDVPQLEESKYANRPEPSTSVPVQQRPNVEANRRPAQDLATADPTPQVRPRKRPAFRVIGDSPPMQRARRTPQHTQGAVPAESSLASSGRQPSLLSRPRTAAVTPVPPRIWESPQTVRPASPTSAVMPERARPTKEVRVAERTSYPLQAPGRVTRITVVDRNVCDVVQHSPYELALIGKHTGQTDIAVWLEGQPTAQVYRIVVGRGGVQPVDQGKLQSLVADLFPESRVTITQRGEAVHVDGVAMNRQEAIKILSVVRSVKLIPVVDNLEVLRR